MKVLQISANFAPNIGGVETHLSDLVNVLIKIKWQVFVLSYRPLSAKVKWKLFERDKNFSVLRIPWFKGYFEKLVPYPILEFIYLVPGLFILTPFVILAFKPNVIHAHGLISAVPAIFWSKFLNKRVIVSIHNIYSFPKHGFYRNFVKFLLKKCDYVLCLSKKSYLEVDSLCMNKKEIRIFTYWIDLNKFTRISLAKHKLNLNCNFIVLFVGRLIVEKGIKEVMESAISWNRNIHLVIAGTGPLEEYIKKQAFHKKNIHFLGMVNQNELPQLYSSADLLIVPSINEEGFGRVIIESLACSTPILASNRGSIPEVMDVSVGKFIDITPQNIKKGVEYFYQHPKELKKMSKKARKFAERRYSENNVKEILNSYTG